jgi:hypothetical protein
MLHKKNKPITIRKKKTTTVVEEVTEEVIPSSKKHAAHTKKHTSLKILIQRPSKKLKTKLTEPASPVSAGKVGPKIPLTPEKRNQDLSKKVCDWLTRILFTGNSKCLACAFFNGQFWIAANELTKSSNSTSKTPAIMILIQEVMQYFSDVAWQKEIPLSHQYNLLLKISQKLATGDSAKGNLIVPSELINDILTRVLSKQSLSQQYCLEKYGQYSPDVSRIATEISIMRDNFENMEHWIKKTTKKDTGNQLLNALKRDIKGYEILLTSEEPIHAEMHILEKILELLAKGEIDENELIYIGISILSCPYCQAMLETAVKIFEKQKISLKLKIQGGHGISPKTWRLPTSFAKGYKQAETDYKQDQSEKPNADKHSISFLIGYRFFSKIQDMHKLSLKINQKKVSQHAPLSDSESSGFDAERKFEEYKEKINQRIASLTTLPFPDREEKNIKLFLELKTSQHLLKLLQALDDHETQRAENHFFSICDELKAKEIEITPKVLLALFKKDETFVGVIRNFAQYLNFDIQPEKKSVSSTLFDCSSLISPIAPSPAPLQMLSTTGYQATLFAPSPQKSRACHSEESVILPVKRHPLEPIDQISSLPLKRRKISLLPAQLPSVLVKSGV